jgi:hypothetical protein
VRGVVETSRNDVTFAADIRGRPVRIVHKVGSVSSNRPGERINLPTQAFGWGHVHEIVGFVGKASMTRVAGLRSVGKHVARQAAILDLGNRIIRSVTPLTSREIVTGVLDEFRMPLPARGMRVAGMTRSAGDPDHPAFIVAAVARTAFTGVEPPRFQKLSVELRRIGIDPTGSVHADLRSRRRRILGIAASDNQKRNRQEDNGALPGHQFWSPWQ